MRLAQVGEVSAGPLGLLVLLLIAVATVLLVRNMNARLKRMPREFPPPPGRQPHDDSTPGDDRL
jgi:hypothetical protein